MADTESRILPDMRRRMNDTLRSLYLPPLGQQQEQLAAQPPVLQQATPLSQATPIAAPLPQQAAQQPQQVTPLPPPRQGSERGPDGGPVIIQGGRSQWNPSGGATTLSNGATLGAPQAFPLALGGLLQQTPADAGMSRGGNESPATPLAPGTPVPQAGDLPTTSPVQGAVAPQITNTSVPREPQFQAQENIARTNQTLNMMNPLASVPYVDVQNAHPAVAAAYLNAVGGAAQQNQSGQLNMLGEMMRNQLGQGQLSLEQQRALGVGGIGGTIANADRDSRSLLEQRTKENDRFGDEARYDAMYQNLLGQFPPGTAPDVRVRRLRERGFAPPRYMGPAQQGSQTTPISGSSPGTQSAGAGSPRVNPNATPTATQTPEVAIENALSSQPVDPATGQRQRPAPGSPEAQRAITQALASIGSDDHLRQQWPAMQQQLIDTFGMDALDQWINHPNTVATSGPEGRAQQSQVQRLLRMAGMNQTPITPFSRGLNFLQRIPAAISLPFSHWLQ